MSKFKPPIVPFVEARFQGAKQRPRAIVIRTSDTTSSEHAALGLANAWHRHTSALQSCHYVVDEAKVYQCTPDRIEAEIAPGRGAIHVCLCAELIEHVDHWDDISRLEVLDRAVDVVAQLALAYKIPIRRLDGAAQQKWDQRNFIRPKGIIFRIRGEFPEDQFLTNVRTQAAFFRAAL